MTLATTSKLEQQPMAPPSRCSLRSSTETTEIIPCTGHQDQVSAASSPKSDEALARVGPWPLKRNASSQTTVVSDEGGPKLDSLEGNPKLSEVLSAVDKHCEQIEHECLWTNSDVAIAAVPYGTKGRPRMTFPGGINFVGSSTPGNREGQTPEDRVASMERDVERQSDQTAHPLGSSCPKCREGRARGPKSTALVLLLVSAAFFAVTVYGPILLIDALSKN